MPPWRHRASPEAVDLEILGSETTAPKIDPVCDPCPRHALETSGRTSRFASSPQLGLGACRASSLSLLLVRSFCLGYLTVAIRILVSCNEYTVSVSPPPPPPVCFDPRSKYDRNYHWLRIGSSTARFGRSLSESDDLARGAPTCACPTQLLPTLL